MGGGIHLQSASELHIQKSKTELRAYVSAANKIMNFTANTADYWGGGGPQFLMTKLTLEKLQF